MAKKKKTKKKVKKTKKKAVIEDSWPVMASTGGIDSGN